MYQISWTSCICMTSLNLNLERPKSLEVLLLVPTKRCLPYVYRLVIQSIPKYDTIWTYAGLSDLQAWGLKWTRSLGFIESPWSAFSSGVWRFEHAKKRTCFFRRTISVWRAAIRGNACRSCKPWGRTKGTTVLLLGCLTSLPLGVGRVAHKLSKRCA